MHNAPNDHDRQDERSWSELLAIALLLEEPVGEAWCLIGAQMVRVHAALAGAAPPRLSRDLDLPSLSESSIARETTTDRSTHAGSSQHSQILEGPPHDAGEH